VGVVVWGWRPDYSQCIMACFNSPWWFTSAKHGSSVSARSLIHGAHTVCVCPSHHFWSHSWFGYCEQCRNLYYHDDLHSFGYMLKSSTAGSYGSSSFTFLRTFHNDFHNDCTNLHSHQQCIRISLSLPPQQYLLSFVFLMIVLLVGVS
jgi:hypothetical protein